MGQSEEYESERRKRHELFQLEDAKIMTTFLRDYRRTKQSVNHTATILGHLSDRWTIFSIIKHEGSEADKKVQGVRTPAIKPNDLTSVPGPAWWRGDNQLLKAVLDLHLNHACCGTHVSSLCLCLSLPQINKFCVFLMREDLRINYMSNFLIHSTGSQVSNWSSLSSGPTSQGKCSFCISDTVVRVCMWEENRKLCFGVTCPVYRPYLSSRRYLASLSLVRYL